MGTKTPDGEKMKRSLPFKLNDEDKARKGEIAASYQKQLTEAEAKKKVAVAMHNEKIKELKAKVNLHLTQINLGVEQKEVQCTAVKNYTANTIEYWYDDQLIESRDMKETEHQMDMAEAAPKKERKAWQKFSTKKQRDLTADEEKTADILAMHKAETSRGGASSMVDPK